MSDIRTGAQRRPYVWLAVALIACLSASCQFLGLDMYPPELQSVSGTCDLPALVYEKTGYTLTHVNSMRQLSSGTTRLLFVMCETDSGNVVMVLDPASLAYRSYKVGASTPFGVDAAGYFLAGNTGYDPGTDSWTPLSTPVPISGYTVLLVSAASDPNPNVLLRASGNSFAIVAAENPWPAAMPSMNYAIPVESTSSGNWRLTDAAAGSSETRMLLRNEGTGLTCYIDYPASPYTLCADAGASMLTTGLLANTTASQKYSFQSNSDRCWLLDGYVVYFEYDHSGRILRYSCADNGVVDSHLIDSSWKDSIYFEPTGERWYYYDARVSKLCVLRTWW